MKAIKQYSGTLVVGCVLACCLFQNVRAQRAAISQDLSSWINNNPTALIQTQPITMKAGDVPSLLQLKDAPLETFLNSLATTPQISADSIPRNRRLGNFYSLQHPEWPPLPCNSYDVPVWQMQDFYLLNDLTVDYETLSGQAMQAISWNGAGCGNSDLSNYQKYKAQSFSVIDTNFAAGNDTNLYNALLSFPNDTNALPTLQIMPYKSGNLLVKANHFDYSGETTRDFALIVNDTIDCPLFKTIDLVNSTNNNQNGWLLQGSVPPWRVTDPMFLIVSNISRTYNGFFRAIPYGGPEIEITGPQPYDVVSNTIMLQADVTDLSGVTNVQFTLDVGGIPARYAIGASNTITLNTKYNIGGAENIYFKATSKPSVYDLLDAPEDNAKLFFSGTTVFPLYFNNDIFLAYASDIASLDVGQNDIDFYATVPVSYTATIREPQSGRLLKSFSGSASPGYVFLLWNFTEQNGTTAFTNDTYVVAFVAAPSANPTNTTTLTITNKIDDGVRKGAGCFITYQEEDPGDINGSVWNSSAEFNLLQTLRSFYVDQYKSYSFTQYTTEQVGTNRNHANCVALTSLTPLWAEFMPGNLANKNYSDLTIGGVHCNADTVGFSGAYLNNKFNTYDLNRWLGGPSAGTNAVKNWRPRKTAIWGCWSGAETGDLTFPQASGIRLIGQQLETYCTKNAGFFFRGPVPQHWITGSETVTTARAALFLDAAFVSGKNAYPGGCDPTYSFRWAVQATINRYPEMDIDPKTGTTGVAMPTLFGCPKLIDTTVYDDELTRLNFNHVKEN